MGRGETAASGIGQLAQAVETLEHEGMGGPFLLLGIFREGIRQPPILDLGLGILLGQVLHRGSDRIGGISDIQHPEGLDRGLGIRLEELLEVPRLPRNPVLHKGAQGLGGSILLDQLENEFVGDGFSIAPQLFRGAEFIEDIPLPPGFLKNPGHEIRVHGLANQIELAEVLLEDFD